MSLQIQVVKPGPKRKKGRRGKKKSSQPRVVVRSSAKSRRRRNRKRSRGKTAKDYSLGYGLNKAHPYIKSLLDPEQHTGRVPDVNNYATTAFQVVEAVELISSADGACGIIFSPTPVDPSTTNYHHGQAGNALGILGTAATVPRNISPIGERCPAAICLMVSGATASKLILRIRYVFNYEAIPTRMSTGFFSVSTTPADRSVIDQASNIVKGLPWSEAWQGIAGVAGRLGQEMAQSAFSAAGSYVGAGVLSALHAGRNRRYAEIDLD